MADDSYLPSDQLKMIIFKRMLQLDLQERELSRDNELLGNIAVAYQDEHARIDIFWNLFTEGFISKDSEFLGNIVASCQEEHTRIDIFWNLVAESSIVNNKKKTNASGLAVSLIKWSVDIIRKNRILYKLAIACGGKRILGFLKLKWRITEWW